MQSAYLYIYHSRLRLTKYFCITPTGWSTMMQMIRNATFRATWRKGEGTCTAIVINPLSKGVENVET